MLADINETAAQAACKESLKLATNPLFQAYAVKVDVSDEESVAAMVAYTLQKFGSIDYCVNSAGVSNSRFSRVPTLAAAFKSST